MSQELRAVLRQFFQRFLCRALLRLFFALARAAAGHLSFDQELYLELLLVVRAALGRDPVFRELFEPVLAELLELRLVIDDAAGSTGIFYPVLEEPENEFIRGVLTSVKVHGRYERLEAVRDQGVLVPPACLLFSAAEQDMGAEPDLAYPIWNIKLIPTASVFINPYRKNLIAAGLHQVFA